MNQEEVEAVLAHEVAHVANGDMVTMTLIQGVVNTFVVFLSRIVGYVVDKQINKDGNGQGIGYFVTSMVCQIVFGILASMIVAWFSRHREFRADAGAATYMGQPNSMISALGQPWVASSRANCQNRSRRSGISDSPASWHSSRPTRRSRRGSRLCATYRVDSLGRGNCSTDASKHRP